MKNFLSKCVKSLSLIFIIILIAINLRTIIYFPTPKLPPLCSEDKNHDPIVKNNGVINRFVEAIKFKTITRDVHDYNRDELIKMINFIIKNYPKIHSSRFIDYEIVNNYSLLYTIKGSDKSLTPYILCGHLDVVAAEDKNWDVNPFGGIIKDGFIYGRGTIDVKNIVMSILEALEFLLEKGFQPKRSFYVAFGHDEESYGVDGAAHIAQTLKAKGVNHLQYLLDEGSVIMNESFSGINKLVAMIGVSEKGVLTVKLTAKGQDGHSSMAPYETAIVKLSKAISKFTSTIHSNMFGSGLVRDMYEELAPYASYPYKLLYSNLWLFGPIFSRILSTVPHTNSMIRTTTAVTIVNGGFKENVLPSSASAFINHRIHPSQTIADVIEYDRKLIDNPEIDIHIEDNSIEPSPVSPYDDNAFGYQIIKKSIRQIYDCAVVPALLMAKTDTLWYANFTNAIYRFDPFVLFNDDMKRFHGHNERLSVDNYIKMINYYHHIIINSNEKDLNDKNYPKDEL